MAKSKGRGRFTTGKYYVNFALFWKCMTIEMFSEYKARVAVFFQSVGAF